MDPTTVIALLNGALSLSHQLIPIVAQFRAEGKMSPEEQARLMAAYNSLRTQADGQFTGPAWQLSTGDKA